MDLRVLKTFQTICKVGSFQRAAEELQYGQSTITMQMQKLESDLGVKLFERGKRLKLTEAGRLLLKEAGHILNSVESLHQTIKDFGVGEAGFIRMGCIETTAIFRLPQLLVPFCQERPKVQLTLEISNSETISQRVAAGELDFGICSPPEANDQITFEPLFTEILGLLIPENHPLAKKERIFAQDLQPHRLLLTGRTCPYRKRLENLLMEKGTNPYSGIEIGGVEVIKHFVVEEFGLAIVPVLAASPPPPGTVLRFIEDFQSYYTVGVVQRVEEHSVGLVVDSLLELLRNQLKTIFQRAESPLTELG